MSRIKGSQIVGLVMAVRAHRQTFLTLAPPQLHKYLDERIIVASWYPEQDFRDLTLLLGKILQPKVPGNVFRLLGLMGAQRDFSGIYASMIRKGQPGWTLRFFSEGWRQYRDSGRLVVEELNEGSDGRMALYEYPVMCVQLAEVNAGYFEGALKAAGASTVHVDVTAFDNTSAHWSLRWK